MCVARSADCRAGQGLLLVNEKKKVKWMKKIYVIAGRGSSTQTAAGREVAEGPIGGDHW